MAEPLALDMASPRRFAVLHEVDEEDPPVVAGWGLQLADRAVFIWCGATDGDSIAIVESAERAATLAGFACPARLVWVDPAEPIG